jgi:hypothetical protein
VKVNIRKYNKGPKERKIDVQIDPWDTYSIDHTLSLIILPALLQLKHSMHGVPNEFGKYIGSDMDSNYTFDFINDDSKEVFDKRCKEWEEILNKMIWSFQQILCEDYDEKYHHGKMQVGWTPIQITNPSTGQVEDMYEMVDKNPNEHWYDHVGHQLHEKRIQEGLDLFGKWYRSLWD